MAITTKTMTEIGIETAIEGGTGITMTADTEPIRKRLLKVLL